MYSIATLASRVLPESNVKDILRHFYYDKIWFNKKLREIAGYLSLLESHSIAFELDLSEFGIRTRIGPSNAIHVFYVDSKVSQELLKDMWLYNIALRYVSVNKKRQLLPFVYISAHGYSCHTKEIFYYNIYERHYGLKPGDVVLDVGANYGVFTIKAARKVGKDGLVIAIEPDPVHVKYLEKNVKLNGLKNVIIVKKAVWSSRKVLRFKRFAGGGANGIADLHLDEVGEFLEKKILIEEINVEADTLDSIIRDLGLSRVDFIKMDIERAEVEAIKGAWKTLQKYSPHLAIAAYHKIPPTYERSYKILEPMLRSLGYKTVIERPVDENPEEVILYGWK